MCGLFARIYIFFRQKSIINRVADRLSRRVNLLLEMKTRVVSFDEFHTFYAIDPYFSKISQALQREDRAAHPSYLL